MFSSQNVAKTFCIGPRATREQIQTFFEKKLCMSFFNKILRSKQSHKKNDYYHCHQDLEDDGQSHRLWKDMRKPIQWSI